MFKFSPSWKHWWEDIEEAMLDFELSLLDVLWELHYKPSDFSRDYVMGKTAYQVAEELRHDYQIKLEERK